MQPVTRISYNTLILLVNNIGTAVLAFALTVLITRGMGSTVFGQYAATMAWIMPLTVLVDFGIGTLITRNVAQNREAANDYLHLTHPFRWILGSLVIAGIWLLTPWLSSDTNVVMALRVGIGMALIDSLFASYTAVFRAWEVMWPILILNIGLLSLQLIGTVLVIWQKGNVIHLLIVIVTADTLQLLSTWFLWRYIRNASPYNGKKDTAQPLSPSLALASHQLLKLALPFAWAGILAVLQARIIILLLDSYVDSAELGQYAASSRLLEAARLAPNALFAALFPQLAALIVQPERFQSLFRRATGLIWGYGLAFALVIWIGADRIVRLFFGDEFRDSAMVLRILAWALLPGLLRALFTIKLYAYQQEHLVNNLLVISLAIQIFAGMMLIPKYHLAGAAWTVIIGETVLAFGMVIAVRSSDKFVRSKTS